MGPFDFAAGSMQEIDYCMTTLFPTYSDTTVVTAQQLQGIDTLLSQNMDIHFGEYLFVPEVNIDETICVGGQYEFRGSTYTEAGNYSVLIRDNGRDTLVRIHLAVHLADNELVEASACDSFVWHDSTYTQSGRYLYRHLDEIGCMQVDTPSMLYNYQTDDPSGAILLEPKFNLNSDWTTYSVVLPSSVANSVQRLYFRWTNDASGGTMPPAAVDSISITAKDCGRPYNLMADNISDSTADITFTPVHNSDSKWEYVYTSVPF